MLIAFGVMSTGSQPETVCVTAAIGGKYRDAIGGWYILPLTLAYKLRHPSTDVRFFAVTVANVRNTGTVMNFELNTPTGTAAPFIRIGAISEINPNPDWNAPPSSA